MKLIIRVQIQLVIFTLIIKMHLQLIILRVIYLIQILEKSCTSRWAVNLIQKFPRNDTQDDNVHVLRLSEMYLIKAEAHAQLNEDTDAQQALDVIIHRALEIPVPPDTLPVSTETGQALQDKILLERRKELAFEGFRLFDLTRHGITFNKYRQDGDPIEINAPANRTILPVPIDEINVNPNIANQQNPGY